MEIAYIKRLQQIGMNSVWKVAEAIQQDRRKEDHPKKDDVDDIFLEAKNQFAKLQE